MQLCNTPRTQLLDLLSRIHLQFPLKCHWNFTYKNVFAARKTPKTKSQANKNWVEWKNWTTTTAAEFSVLRRDGGWLWKNFGSAEFYCQTHFALQLHVKMKMKMKRSAGICAADWVGFPGGGIFREILKNSSLLICVSVSGRWCTERTLSYKVQFTLCAIFDRERS